MVLVDSTIWIDYFKRGAFEALDTLLVEDLVVTNQLILAELIPTVSNRGEKELIQGLRSLPLINLDIDWDSIVKLQTLNIQKGLNEVGIPDLIILQQVIQENLTLWTADKNFYRMLEFVSFKIY